LSAKKINWTGILFYSILFAIIVLALLYVFWHDGPIRTGVNNLVSLISSKIQLPQFSFEGITDFLKNNGVLLGTAASLGTTAIAYFVKNYQTNKLLDQKIQELNEEKIKAFNAMDINKTLEDKLKLYETDTTADELQKSLSTITGEKSALEKQVSNLQSQIELLNKQPAQMAESLWAKSGGQVITEGGHTYRIIEKQSVLVK
jgi:cell division protein FtsB